MSYKTFRETIRNYVLPFYKLNDKAHMIDHVDEVCDDALAYNRLSGYNLDLNLIIAAAYIHDIANNSRDNHHHIAHDLVMERPEPFKSFTDEELKLVALACREHRSSWKGAFSSKLSEIISIADRGKPNAMLKLHRSYKYARSKENKSHEESLKHAINHIKEKYTRDAILKYPEYYQVHFKDEIAIFHDTIETMDAQRLATYIEG